jgi:hypothetical protein
MPQALESGEVEQRALSVLDALEAALVAARIRTALPSAHAQSLADGEAVFSLRVVDESSRVFDAAREVQVRAGNTERRGH